MNRKNNVISEIKNEDKKSRGKFIFITLLSALGGGMIGILLVYSFLFCFFFTVRQGNYMLHGMKKMKKL